MMKKLFRELWLLICACVPGCGQMQQGYMKRGVSQTSAFCAILAVAVFLEAGALACFLAPLWAYSFFDAYNLRRMAREGTPQEDSWLFGLSDMDARRLRELMERRHSLIGWTLVLVGLLVLWQSIARIIYNFLDAMFDFGGWGFYDSLVHGVPRLAVTLAIIALGVWFIRGPKKREEDPVQDYAPPRPEEPFTARDPWSPEAQTPVKLQLHPDRPEEAAAQPDPTQGGADPGTPQETSPAGIGPEDAQDREEARHGDGN